MTSNTCLSESSKQIASNLVLELDLLLDHILRFTIQICTDSSSMSPFQNDKVACRKGISVGATLWSRSLSRTALLWASHSRHFTRRYLPRARRLSLARFGVFYAYPPRSQDVATVYVKRTTSFAAASLPGDKSLSFVMFLLDWLRCSFVDLLIAASLNLEIWSTFLMCFTEDWRKLSVMSC